MFRVPHYAFHGARVPIEGVKRPLRLDTGYLRGQIPRNAGQEGVGVVPFDVENTVIVRLKGRSLGFYRSSWWMFTIVGDESLP